MEDDAEGVRLLKITILAIDGMDRNVAAAFGQKLPNLCALMQMNPVLPLTSVFPPDTDTVWASLYTGLSPAQHGVVNFQDPMDPGRLLPKPSDESLYRGKCFWDFAGSLKKRCCVCLPHNIFPGWPINGVLLTRGRVTKKFPLCVRCIPPHSCIDSRLCQSLASQVSKIYGEDQFAAAFELISATWLAESEAAWRLYNAERWDVYFAYFSAIDAAQHFSWRFYDNLHPDYVKGHQFENVVLDVYCWIDKLVGKFMNSLGEEELLLVVSDHGHGRRPTKIFNLNRYLHGRGLLAISQSKKALIRSAINQSARRCISRFVSKYGSSGILRHMSGLAAKIKNEITSATGVDYARSKAYVLEMGSMKHYSYGGIRLRCDASERPELMHDLMGGLSQLRTPDSDRALVEWIADRDEMYSGDYLSAMPDIFIELQEDYGISSAASGQLFEEGYMHRIQSGSHRRMSPTFLYYCKNPRVSEYLIKDIGEKQFSFMELHRRLMSWIACS
jgi:predicted AlkP superfamily phosphohydrolase/phosphomutase